MRVEEIMSHEVVFVSPDTTLKNIAELLGKHRISGVPVCGRGGKVLGVVSESDILWKEAGESGREGRFRRMLGASRDEKRRTEARTAGEAMTAPAITIAPGRTVAQAAKLMIERQVNRLPVVNEGQLVGIVARADLVRAFRRSDDEIEREISKDVLLNKLWVDPDSVSLVVIEGHVTMAGTVENRSTAELIESCIRRVPGVVSVRSKLGWEIDDRARRTTRSANQFPLKL